MPLEPPPITVAICSNRAGQLDGLKRVQPFLRCQDQLIIVVDGIDGGAADLLGAREWTAQVDIIRHSTTLGLSACRNEIIARSRMRYLLFLDDDIVLTSKALEAIRAELDGSVAALGIRLERPTWLVQLPWWMTEGQLHYLGVHTGLPPFSIWGGCMAIDVDFARREGLTFRPELGRTGSGLQSGDDSTFVADVSRCGGALRFLSEPRVVHNFSVERLRFAYLARRVFWQGRSEVRRSNVVPGIAKEWRRYRRNAGDTSVLWGLAVSLLCLGLLVAGVVWEFAASRDNRDRGPKDSSVGESNETIDTCHRRRSAAR